MRHERKDALTAIHRLCIEAGLVGRGTRLCDNVGLWVAKMDRSTMSSEHVGIVYNLIGAVVERMAEREEGRYIPLTPSPRPPAKAEPVKPDQPKKAPPVKAPTEDKPVKPDQPKKARQARGPKPVGSAVDELIRRQRKSQAPAGAAPVKADQAPAGPLNHDSGEWGKELDEIGEKVTRNSPSVA